MRTADPRRKLLLLAAAVSYAAVFALLVFVERPGLGLGRFFFISIVLLALAADAWLGALGGVLATALYVVAVLANPHVANSNIANVADAVRFASFVAVGALIGYFAKEHRELVGRLRALADRDELTGLPRGRAFESEMRKRLEASEPFSLLIAEFAGAEDADADSLLHISRLIMSRLDPRDALVRVGQDEFGVLTSLPSGEDAGKLAATLESVLDQQGLDVTFGWAVVPQDGTDALSLCRAADERRYARAIIRAGRLQPATA
jgi:GGDEF domain-containing protein